MIDLIAIRARDADYNDVFEAQASMSKDIAHRLVAWPVADRRALLAYVDELLAEREARKGDASARLHNLCAALERDLDESPFTQEEWSRMDGEIIECRNAYDELREAARKVTCERCGGSTCAPEHGRGIPAPGTCPDCGDLRRLLEEKP